MGKRRIKKRSSTKGIHKNSVFKVRDFKFPVERTASGTLYARLPNGQLVKVSE